MSALAECLVAFVFGSVVGLLVQRSRFCNTAALRDAMLFKTFRNTKALLVAMMILTIGFTAFISIGAGNPMRFDVGVNQILGLFLFGTVWCWQEPARCRHGSRRGREISVPYGR